MDAKRHKRLTQHTTPIMIALLTACVLAGDPSQTESGDYRSPVSLVAGSDGKALYIAEATASRLTVRDTELGQVIREIPVGEHPVGLALSGDGSVLYVTSATPEGTVPIVDVARGTVLETIAVGHTPVAVVPDPDGKTLCVCNQFSNNVGMVDLDEAAQIATVAVPREPVAAVLTANGKSLLVTNHLPVGPADTDYAACVISVIDTATRTLLKNIELPDGSTNLQGIALSPDDRYAYVTPILARDKFPATYLERGWVNTNAKTVIDVPGQEYLNTVLLDDPTRRAANPYDVACTSDSRSIVISHAGTHELSVINRAGLHA